MTQGPHRPRGLRIGLQDPSLFIVLAILVAVFASLTDRFLQVDNLANLLLQSTAVGAAATGMTLVIMTAGIDLSVGSTMNLSLVIAVAVAGSPGAMEYTPRPPGSSTRWRSPPAPR